MCQWDPWVVKKIYSAARGVCGVLSRARGQAGDEGQRGPGEASGPLGSQEGAGGGGDWVCALFAQNAPRRILVSSDIYRRVAYHCRRK
jgi:hypothetical protein